MVGEWKSEKHFLYPVLLVIRDGGDLTILYRDWSWWHT